MANTSVSLSPSNLMSALVLREAQKVIVKFFEYKDLAEGTSSDPAIRGGCLALLEELADTIVNGYECILGFYNSNYDEEEDHHGELGEDRLVFWNQYETRFLMGLEWEGEFLGRNNPASTREHLLEYIKAEFLKYEDIYVVPSGESYMTGIIEWVAEDVPAHEPTPYDHFLFALYGEDEPEDTVRIESVEHFLS